jgi:hypothetical protein
VTVCVDSLPLFHYTLAAEVRRLVTGERA